MRARVSLFFALLGLVIILFSLTLSGQARVANTVLGLIIACAGCFAYLAAGRFGQTHRSFVIVVGILLVILIIGYAVKIFAA